MYLVYVTAVELRSTFFGKVPDEGLWSPKANSASLPNNFVLLIEKVESKVFFFSQGLDNAILHLSSLRLHQRL